MQLGNDCLNGAINAALQGDGVRTSRNVAQALTDQCLCQNGSGRGAVTCNVIGLLGNFLDQFCTDTLEGIFEVDFLSNGNAILGRVSSTTTSARSTCCSA